MFGVSHSAVDRVYRYIRDQKQHHQKRTFESEYIKFIELHGFDDVKLDYLLFSKSFTPLAVKSDFI